MGRIEDYIFKQKQIIDLSKGRKAVAEIIAENLKEFKSAKDFRLRIQNIHGSQRDESRVTYPVHGDKSPDPVYRKLSKAIKYVHHNRCSGEGILAEYINQLQIKMENRKMREEEYSYLEKTSMKQLIFEFSDMLKV